MVTYDEGTEFRQLTRVFPQFIESLYGKRILDFGCGLGFQTAALARYGVKEAVGLDINPTLLAQARTRNSRYVRFIDHLDPNDQFDVIVSQNAFEHFINAPTVLEAMRRALAPGGRIFISFGPPWYAPWGAHVGFFCRLPWVQVLFPESTVLAVRSRYRTGEAGCYEDIGLARMSVGKFERIVKASGLQIAYQKYDCVGGFDWLQHTPLRELFVNQINSVLSGVTSQPVSATS